MVPLPATTTLCFLPLSCFVFFFIALKTTIILYLFIVHLPYQNDNAIKIDYLVIFSFLYL